MFIVRTSRGEKAILRAASANNSCGALIELRPVPNMPPVPALSIRGVGGGYADEVLAAFENHCGKASD